MGKTTDLFKKIRDTKGTFHAKMGTIKDRNYRDRTEAKDFKKRWQGYTVKVINRFKGLDLIDRVPEELWTEVCDIVQEAMIKTISKRKNAKRQNGCLRRPYK